MRKFVVAGVQRTGTTLITTSLNSHPHVHCAGELFKMTKASWNHDVIDGGYRTFRDASLGLRMKDLFLRNRLVPGFLDQFFERPGFDAIGFKLMLNHTRSDRFPMVLPYLIKQHVSVIHVLRENVLRTHVSRLMASHRRVYHMTERPTELPKLSVPLDDLETRLKKIAADADTIYSLFHGHVPYLSVSYENYLRNSQFENERMLTFLGLPQRELHSPLVRINPEDLPQTVANWEQVSKRLQDTPFAKFLKDSL